MANFLDTALDIYSEIRALGRELDKLDVGEQGLAEIPEDLDLNALVVKGKGGKRFKIIGIQLERTK